MRVNDSLSITTTQHEIIRGIALGNTRKEIAARIGKDEKTVDFHLNGTDNPRSIKAQLNLNSTADIVKFALRNNLVKDGESAKPKPVPTAEVKPITTTGELAQTLLRGASQAAAGKADVLQINALVQCSDAVIRLCRLQMDAANAHCKIIGLE